MRKVWLAIAVVAVVVAGYLGAQAYSSHVFERELTATLKALRADGQWQVERDDIERGWFQSRGRLLVAPATDDNWRVALPYQASHGLLSTDVSGALQVYLKESSSAGERALFGDLLPSAEPRWTATFETLDRRVKARLDAAAFELARDSDRLAFGGAWFTLAGRVGDISLRGQVASMRLGAAQGEIVSGPLTIDSRYQFGSAGGFYHQRNELSLERLEYHGGQRPPITLIGLHYRDETRLAEQLRLDASVSLEKALVAGETLLSGSLDMSVDRLDGDAVRRVVAQLEAAGKKSGGDLSALDDAQRQALVERLEPALLGMLSDSPRLILEGLTLTSPMFGFDMRGHGELIFDGENVAALSVDELVIDGESEAWRRHLNGAFTLYGVPPLAAMQLGLPPDTDTLDVVIEAGEVSINGRPLPPLF
ncbi:protein of unknown function [Modicisalibacter muralis]|uniref:DUF945 domain-containing protein n=1 Tax=Modicisalibacter muralis TaxID=119000 RepID=A0A1G9RJA3_9GAMM|nr:DUF945 family protein [Halomonas muralis]SDM23140.1 protein of unknown function [Halomonas muralis]